MTDLRIALSQPDDAAAMDAVVAAVPGSLIYYTSLYREFLRRVIPEAECLVLTAWRGERLAGFLPMFIRTADPFGAIINSQPFFGSHGGAVVAPGDSQPAEVKVRLYSALADIARERDVAAMTVIENPFDPLSDAEQAALGTAVVDHRIGQFTPLPAEGDIEAAIMARLHVKTRNAVRKGQKLAPDIDTTTASEDIAWLHGVHAESIGSMGGVVKSLDTFRALFDVFAPTDQVRLYIGRKAGRPVCGVLILLHGDTVEYFTPVVEPDYRDTQALSALLVEIMMRIAREGFRTWNWGGTWPSQEGVHRFKSRWGAFERSYRYHNRVFRPELAAANKAAVLADYPYFYAYRFG